MTAALSETKSIKGNSKHPDYTGKTGNGKIALF